MQAAVSNSKITNRIKLRIFKGYLESKGVFNEAAALLHFQCNESAIDNANNKALFRAVNMLKGRTIYIAANTAVNIKNGPLELLSKFFSEDRLQHIFGCLEEYIDPEGKIAAFAQKHILVIEEDDIDLDLDSDAPITVPDSPELDALYAEIYKNIGFKSQAASATVVAAPGDLVSEFHRACLAITEPLQQMVNNAVQQDATAVAKIEMAIEAGVKQIKSMPVVAAAPEMVHSAIDRIRKQQLDYLNSVRATVLKWQESAVGNGHHLGGGGAGTDDDASHDAAAASGGGGGYADGEDDLGEDVSAIIDRMYGSFIESEQLIDGAIVQHLADQKRKDAQLAQDNIAIASLDPKASKAREKFLTRQRSVGIIEELTDHGQLAARRNFAAIANIPPTGRCRIEATERALILADRADLAEKASLQGFINEVRAACLDLLMAKSENPQLSSENQQLEGALFAIYKDAYISEGEIGYSHATFLQWLEKSFEAKSWDGETYFNFIALRLGITIQIISFNHKSDCFVMLPQVFGTGSKVITLAHVSSNGIDDSGLGVNQHFDVVIDNLTESIKRLCSDNGFKITECDGLHTEGSQRLVDEAVSSLASDRFYGAGASKGDGDNGNEGKYGQDQDLTAVHTHHRREPVAAASGSAVAQGGGGMKDDFGMAALHPRRASASKGSDASRVSLVAGDGELSAADLLLQQLPVQRRRKFGADAKTGASSAEKTQQQLKELEDDLKKIHYDLNQYQKLINTYVASISQKADAAALQYFDKEFAVDAVGVAQRNKLSQLEKILLLLSTIQNDSLKNAADSREKINKTTTNKDAINKIDDSINTGIRECNALRTLVFKAAQEFFNKIFTLDKRVDTPRLPARRLRLRSILQHLVTTETTTATATTDATAAKTTTTTTTDNQARRDLNASCRGLRKLLADCDSYVQTTITAPAEYEVAIKAAKADLEDKRDECVSHINSVQLSESSLSLMQMNENDLGKFAKHRKESCFTVNSRAQQALDRFDAMDFTNPAWIAHHLKGFGHNVAELSAEEVKSFLEEDISKFKLQMLSDFEDNLKYKFDTYVMTQELQRYIDIAGDSLVAAVAALEVGRFELFQKMLAQCSEYLNVLKGNGYITGAKAAPQGGEDELQSKIAKNEKLQAEAVKAIAACAAFKEQVEGLLGEVDQAKQNFQQLTEKIKALTLDSDLSKAQGEFEKFSEEIVKIKDSLTAAQQEAKQFPSLVSKIKPLLTATQQAAVNLVSEEDVNNTPVITNLAAQVEDLVAGQESYVELFKKFTDFKNKIASCSTTGELSALREKLAVFVRTPEVKSSIFSKAFANFQRTISDKISEQEGAAIRATKGKFTANVIASQNQAEAAREKINLLLLDLRKSLLAIENTNFAFQENFFAGLVDSAQNISEKAKNWQGNFDKKDLLGIASEFTDDFNELSASALAISEKAAKAEQLFPSIQTILQQVVEQFSVSDTSVARLLRGSQFTLKSAPEVKSTLENILPKIEVFNQLAHEILAFPGLPLIETLGSFAESFQEISETYQELSEQYADQKYGELFNNIFALVKAKHAACQEKIDSPSVVTDVAVLEEVAAPAEITEIALIADFAAVIYSLNKTSEQIEGEISICQNSQNGLKRTDAKYKKLTGEIRTKEDGLVVLAEKIEALSALQAQAQEVQATLTNPLAADKDVLLAALNVVAEIKRNLTEQEESTEQDKRLVGSCDSAHEVLQCAQDVLVAKQEAAARMFVAKQKATAKVLATDLLEKGKTIIFALQKDVHPLLAEEELRKSSLIVEEYFSLRCKLQDLINSVDGQKDDATISAMIHSLYLRHMHSAFIKYAKHLLQIANQSAEEVAASFGDQDEENIADAIERFTSAISNLRTFVYEVNEFDVELLGQVAVQADSGKRNLCVIFASFAKELSELGEKAKDFATRKDQVVKLHAIINPLNNSVKELTARQTDAVKFLVANYLDAKNKLAADNVQPADIIESCKKVIAALRKDFANSNEACTSLLVKLGGALGGEESSDISVQLSSEIEKLKANVARHVKETLQKLDTTVTFGDIAVRTSELAIEVRELVAADLAGISMTDITDKLANIIKFLEESNSGMGEICEKDSSNDPALQEHTNAIHKVLLSALAIATRLVGASLQKIFTTTAASYVVSEDLQNMFIQMKKAKACLDRSNCPADDNARLFTASFPAHSRDIEYVIPALAQAQQFTTGDKSDAKAAQAEGFLVEVTKALNALTELYGADFTSPGFKTPDSELASSVALRTVGLQLNKIKIANTGIKDLVRAYTAEVAEFNALAIIDLLAVKRLQGFIASSTAKVQVFIASNLDKANDQRIQELTAAQEAAASAVSDILEIQANLDDIERALMERQNQNSTDAFSPDLPEMPDGLKAGAFADAVEKIANHIVVVQSAIAVYNNFAAYKRDLAATRDNLAIYRADNFTLNEYKELPVKILSRREEFINQDTAHLPKLDIHLGSLSDFFTLHETEKRRATEFAGKIVSNINKAKDSIGIREGQLKDARAVVAAKDLLDNSTAGVISQCNKLTAALVGKCNEDIAKLRENNATGVFNFAISYLESISSQAENVVASSKLELVDGALSEIQLSISGYQDIADIDLRLLAEKLHSLSSHIAIQKGTKDNVSFTNARGEEITAQQMREKLRSLSQVVFAIEALNKCISDLSNYFNHSNTVVSAEAATAAAAIISDLLNNTAEKARNVVTGLKNDAPKLAAQAEIIKSLVESYNKILTLQASACAGFHNENIMALNVLEFQANITLIKEFINKTRETLKPILAQDSGEEKEDHPLADTMREAGKSSQKAKQHFLYNSLRTALRKTAYDMAIYGQYSEYVKQVQDKLNEFNAISLDDVEDLDASDNESEDGGHKPDAAADADASDDEYSEDGSQSADSSIQAPESIQATESKAAFEKRSLIAGGIANIAVLAGAVQFVMLGKNKRRIRGQDIKDRFKVLSALADTLSRYILKGHDTLVSARKDIASIKKDFESIKVKVASLANSPKSEEVAGVAELAQDIRALIVSCDAKSKVVWPGYETAPLLAGSIASVKQIQVELQNLIPHKLAELAVERRVAGLEKIKATLETRKASFTDEQSAELFVSMSEQIALCDKFIDDNNNAADPVIAAQVVKMKDIKTELHIAALDLCLVEITKMIDAAPPAASSFKALCQHFKKAEEFYTTTEDWIGIYAATLGREHHQKVAEVTARLEEFKQSLLEIAPRIAKFEVEQVARVICETDTGFEETSLDAAENLLDDLIAHLKSRSKFVSTFKDLTPILDKLPEENTQRQALTAELTKLYDDFRVRTAELEIKMVHLKLDLLDKELAGFNFDSEEERIERKVWFKEYLGKRRVYLCDDRYKKDCPNALELALPESVSSVSIELQKLAGRAVGFKSHTEDFVNNVVGVYLFDHMAEAQRGIPSHVRLFVEHYKLLSSGNHKTSVSSVDPKKSFDVVLPNWIVTLNTSYRFSTLKDVEKGNPSSTLLQQVLGSYAFSSVKPSVDSKALTPYELLQRIHDGIPLLKRYAGLVRDLGSKEKDAPGLIKGYFVVYFQDNDKNKLLQSIEILNEEYRVLLKKLADDYVQIFELSKLVLEYGYPIAGVTNIEKPAPVQQSLEGQLLRYFSRYGDAFAVDKFKSTYRNDKSLLIEHLAREIGDAKDAAFSAKYDSFINKLFSDFIPLSGGAVDADTMEAVIDAIYACASNQDQKVAAASVLKIIKEFKTGRDIISRIETALINKGYRREGLSSRITQCLVEEIGLLRTSYRKEVLDPSLVAKVRDSSLCDFDFGGHDGSVSGVNKDGSSFSGEASYSSMDYDPSFYQPDFLDILEKLFAEHADLSNKDFDSLCKLRHSLISKISNFLKSFKPFAGYEVIERYCAVLAAGLNKINDIESATDDLFPEQLNLLTKEKFDAKEKFDEITAKVICSNKYPYRESKLYDQDKQQYIDLLKLFGDRLNKLRAYQSQASCAEAKKEIGQKLTDISEFEAGFEVKYEKIFAELDKLTVESGGKGHKEKVMSKAAEDLLVRFIDEATNIFKSLIVEELGSIKDNKNTDVLARFKTATTKCGLVKKIMHTFGAFTEDGLPNSAAFTQSRKGSGNTATKYLALKDRLFSGDIARWILMAKKHVLGIKDAYKTFKDSFLLEDKIYNENELAIFSVMQASDASPSSGKAKNSKAGGSRTPFGTPEKPRTRRASAESGAGGGGAKGANFHGSFDVASSNTGGHGMDSDRRDSAESGGGSERPKSLSVQRWEREGEGESDALNASSSSAGRLSGGASVDDALPLAEFNQSEFINAFNYSGMMALYLVEYVRYISKFITNHKDPDLRSCYSTVKQMYRSISKKKVTGPDAKDFQSMQLKMQELQIQLEKRVAEFHSATEEGQNYGRNKFINAIMELVALIYNKSTQLEERARGMGLSHYLYAELAYSMAKSAWGAIGWDIEKYGVFSQQSYYAQKKNLAKKITVPNFVVLSTKLTVKTSTGPLAGEMTVARNKAEDYFKAKFARSFNCVEKIVEYFLQAGGVARSESSVRNFVNDKDKFAGHDDLIKLRTLLQRLIPVWTDIGLIRPTTFSDQSSVGSGSQSENRSQASSIVVYQVGSSTFTVLYEHFAMILLAIKNRIIEIFNGNFIVLESYFNEANSGLKKISYDNESSCDTLQLHFSFVWQQSMQIIRDCQLELSRHSADSVVEDSCQAKLQDIISKANTIAKESAENRFTILQAQYPVANLTSATPEVKSSAELGIKQMAKIFEVEVRGVLEKIISAEYSTATSADLLFVFLDKMHAYILPIDCNAHPALQETVEITSALYTIVKKVAEIFISSSVDKKTISSVALFIKRKLGLLLREYHDDGLTESSESSRLPSPAHAVSGSGSYQDIDMSEALAGTVKVFIKDCNKYLRITNTPGYGHAKTSLFGGGGAAAIAPSQNTSGAGVASVTSANGTGGGSRSGGGGAAASAPSQNMSRASGGSAAPQAVDLDLVKIRSELKEIVHDSLNVEIMKDYLYLIEPLLDEKTDLALWKRYLKWFALFVFMRMHVSKFALGLGDLGGSNANVLWLGVFGEVANLLASNPILPKESSVHDLFGRTKRIDAISENLKKCSQDNCKEAHTSYAGSLADALLAEAEKIRLRIKSKKIPQEESSDYSALAGGMVDAAKKIQSKQPTDTGSLDSGRRLLRTCCIKSANGLFDAHFVNMNQRVNIADEENNFDDMFMYSLSESLEALRTMQERALSLGNQ